MQTESAESGSTISAKEVANLMLNGRNFQQLVELRAEAFNIFNHPNINSSNTSFNFNSATNANSFGYATAAGNMRQLELSVRVNFESAITRQRLVRRSF